MLEHDLEITEAISLLHEQTNNVYSLLVSLNQIVKYFSPDPFVGITNYTDDVINKIFSTPIGRLEGALQRLIDSIGNDLQVRHIPSSIWDKLKECLNELIICKADSTAIAPLKLREVALNIRNEIDLLLTQTPRPGISKERRNEVLYSVKEIDRLVCLYDLHRVIDRTSYTHNHLISLIHAQRGDSHRENPIGFYRVNEIVRETITSFRDIADDKGIHIKLRDNSPDAMVNVPRQDLRKALGNLLDNAIKYTGELPFDSTYEHTWVEIRITSNIKKVSIAFESWGLPITSEESQGDFVFKEGYRGWFARQTGIHGTGTGLPDVRNFAIRNEGEVTYDSTPVSKLTNVFASMKTTVTLTLPFAIDPNFRRDQ
jgi:signal transduction histidine kinase